MGKKGKKKSSGEGWSHERHEDRFHRKLDKERQNLEQQQQEDDEEQVQPKKKKVKGYHRSMALSHDTHEKREEGKLKLHMTKVKRDIAKLRSRLKAWDDMQEYADAKRAHEEAEKKRKREEEEATPGYVKKRRGRLGPETWKLRGAARPAWEVYDFDTRYVDPYIKAHQEALAKAKRSINAFHVYKGRFGKIDTRKNESNNTPSALLIETSREFLAKNMQLALLSMEAKKFKTARETFLEIIELEGSQTLDPLTNARCRLMRMYLEANRPDSARRLWEKLPSNYSSVWIRYSAVLLEFVSWKILEEEGSSEESAKELLTQAIRSNVFCAYYMAFNETFHQVMEYTDEVEDAEDGTLEQAIEYCNSEQMGSWLGTEGAVEWVRTIIIKTLNSKEEDPEGGLMRSDLEWETKLETLESDFEKKQSSDRDIEENGGRGDNGEEDEVDLQMFAGMVRTSMEMLADAGEFRL